MPILRTSSRPSLPVHAARAVLAAALLTAGLIGCDESATDRPSSPPATANLVVLAGEPGAAELTVHDGRGRARRVGLPTRSVAWLSTSRQGTLLATLDDGRLRVSDRLRGDEEPEWTPIPAADVDLPSEPLYFATWSPNGLRLVALAARFPRGAQTTLAVVGVRGDASLLLPVPARPLVAPPAWIDDDLILVQTASGLAVVDTATGDVGAGPPIDLGEGIPLATSPDGTLVALAPEAGTIEIRDLRRWMAGEGGPASTRIEVDGEVGGLAFDRRAGRLAVAWQRPDGPGRLTIYRGANGWERVEERTLPGDSSRAVVDWLP